MEATLFSEFPQITKNDWLNQVNKDLKGKNFEETLIWQTLEGFQVQPYYSSEDLANIPTSAIQAAQRDKANGIWQNRPYIEFSDEKTTNLAIISSLKKGATSILLDLDKVDIENIDLAKLLNNIKLSESPVFFKTSEGLTLLNQLSKVIPYLPKGGIHFDTLANTFADDSTKMSIYTWENTIKILNATAQFPNFGALVVESHVYHNAGANAVQELAFTLASAVEYLDKLSEQGLTIEHIVTKLEFSVSIGTNYFLEIAKLRALRFLWSKILESYGQANFIKKCQVHAQTSSFYNAALSPYTNMLRATTEAMSAIMGGCDSLTILPYDAVLDEQQRSELGERIARNISIILKEESYLDKAIDPSAGSYYIENLTYQLSLEAWKVFQEVEAKGGMVAAFEQGFIQVNIEKALQANVERLQNGKIMVGVNKFRVEPEANSKNSLSVSSQKLQSHRLSEVFE
ncbi:methylmalonyl-CoA mutase [Emticicia oligotrophica DSM 17448]|uniref:Methylmalonyl-CoA mutase n=1 Tax=Emticicia oligotrophica (strain DSM 17448 / CIP 109782 / MTCC 6937 / GPTSA100-15) TaxID=929562 RepID=A0ABM5N7Q0_EMTOG|nr:methylmalonyl-CoA mutase subunit beta [Emticicia oligotrophica]AFK05440.1 methylmalonyl-CoA mutase [Emticicia oligotrophica DSM 17448]